MVATSWTVVSISQAWVPEYGRRRSFIGRFPWRDDCVWERVVSTFLLRYETHQRGPP